MSDEHLKQIRNLLSDFGEMSLTNFRDAFLPLVRDKNPTIDRYLVEELKNFRGNRGMRAVIANALTEREDESYLEDFASVIEKETDVGLCKECIHGLVRIATQEAMQKLDFLAKSKPNATISALLKQELDKIRHDEREPVTYYLDHLTKGNQNARNCIHAAKVLVKMGDRKVVDEIINRFNQFDDLARSEGAKVVARLGEERHLNAMLDILDRYMSTYQNNERFLSTVDGFSQAPKDERVVLLRTLLDKIALPEQGPLVERFKTVMEIPDIAKGQLIRDEIIEMGNPVGMEYVLESLIQILDNKIAHANKYHEDSLRAGRVRHSRLRHLVAEAGYGIGRIGSLHEEEDSLRTRAVDRMIQLVRSPDSDVVKSTLFGCAFFVRPVDVELLDATLETHQIEGMTRLLRTLERKPAGQFTDFFLKVAMKHEILDIQEMAMKALGDTSEVHGKVRRMLESEIPETKRTAIRIIGEIRCNEFLDQLLALLDGQSDIIRIEAITALGKLGHKDVLARINHVMYDAKSQVLVEVCLKAIAMVGGEYSIALLVEFTEKTRNRKTAVIAIQLLVESYKSWTHALPPSTSEIVINQLKVWFEDRDTSIRLDSYRIAALMITFDLNIYNTLKLLFKDANTRLRSQANWDKDEMALVDECLRIVNRNFFFLKEMQEFWKEVTNRCRNHDHPSSVTRVTVYEKLISLLESNDKFLLSAENEKELETVVFKGLELESGSWREQSLLFKIAGFSVSPTLREELITRLKTVPKQSRADLMDALAHMGYGLAEISDMVSIRKILVLEGSGFYRKKLVSSLKDAGYEVRDCGDVEIGKAMIKSQTPDLIVTEVNFGADIAGLEFSEKLAKEYGSRIQLIFSTNVREAALIDRIAQLKPLAILHKPYPFEKLHEVIKG